MWKIVLWALLGGVVGFVVGTGVFYAFVASSGGAMGRTGTSILIVLPPPVLAVIGLIVGAIVGIMRNRKRP